MLLREYIRSMLRSYGNNGKLALDIEKRGDRKYLRIYDANLALSQIEAGEKPDYHVIAFAVINNHEVEDIVGNKRIAGNVAKNLATMNSAELNPMIRNHYLVMSRLRR